MALASGIMVSFQTLLWWIFVRQRFSFTAAHCLYNRSEDRFVDPEDIPVQLGISLIFLNFQVQSEINILSKA